MLALPPTTELSLEGSDPIPSQLKVTGAWARCTHHYQHYQSYWLNCLLCLGGTCCVASDHTFRSMLPCNISSAVLRLRAARNVTAMKGISQFALNWHLVRLLSLLHAAWNAMQRQCCHAIHIHASPSFKFIWHLITLWHEYTKSQT